jgi:hypothetical protein
MWRSQGSRCAQSIDAARRAMAGVTGSTTTPSVATSSHCFGERRVGIRPAVRWRASSLSVTSLIAKSPGTATSKTERTAPESRGSPLVAQSSTCVSRSHFTVARFPIPRRRTPARRDRRMIFLRMCSGGCPEASLCLHEVVPSRRQNALPRTPVFSAFVLPGAGAAEDRKTL